MNEDDPEFRLKKLANQLAKQLKRVDRQMLKLEDLCALDEDNERFAFFSMAELVLELLVERVEQPKDGDLDHISPRDLIIKLLDVVLERKLSEKTAES